MSSELNKFSHSSASSVPSTIPSAIKVLPPFQSSLKTTITPASLSGEERVSALNTSHSRPFSGDSSHMETQFVRKAKTMTQPLKSPATSLQSSAKGQPDFQFKVPTKVVRRITMPTSTDVYHKGRNSPPTVTSAANTSHSETMDWSNFAAASQVDGDQLQTGISTTAASVSLLSVSASCVDGNKQAGVGSGSTFLLEGGAGREACSSTVPPTYLASCPQEMQYEQQQQQLGDQEIQHKQPPGSIQELHYDGREPQYDGQQSRANPGYGQQPPATTFPGSHQQLGYEGQQQIATDPGSRQELQFGQELATNQEQQHGEQLAAGSQGLAQVKIILLNVTI